MAEKIQNPIEHTTFRSEWVQNQPGGTITIHNTTGHERLQLSHHSGGNLRFDNKCASWFAPYTNQSLTLGQSYVTVGGDSFERVVKHKESRVNGDFTIITGDDNFFASDVASEYVEANREIAALQTSPELQYGATGNNTKAEFVDRGSPNPKSGAVSGGSYPKSPTADKVQEARKEKVPQITELEKQMGVGGSIKLNSCKHIYLQAGTTAINYDSGRCVPNGQDVVRKWQWTGSGNRDQYGADNSSNSHKEIRTSAPIYESVDTSSAMPFGDITFNAMGKINMQTGSGGFHVQTAGEAKLTSTGRLSLGGHEVAIGGGSSNNAGTVRVVSDVLFSVKSDDMASIEAPFINNIGTTQITHITPKFHCTNDVHIERDLRVQRNVHIQGNLHVHGDITCNGNITCDKDMVVKGSKGLTVTNGDINVSKGSVTAAVNVIGGGVSLNSHTHGGVDRGGSNTNRPNR